MDTTTLVGQDLPQGLRIVALQDRGLGVIGLGAHQIEIHPPKRPGKIQPYENWPDGISPDAVDQVSRDRE